ncbi:hypothetical protein [Brucella sp. 10RB9213]|uniref:hypothetical protein n=1 Tax=Brucella sp. 10RB9213 TaxID=1844039 RepID=UPI0012ADD3C4|nr:hypothetical protein [Brucella sp. 10RB9213]MRN68005.1 hypothetical protein [Brucella sp. 10RB9213]
MAEYCGIKIIVCEPGMVIKDQRGQEFVVTESNVVFDGTHAYVSPKTNEQFATAATSHFPVQATVNIDEIVQPLEDIHAPDGLCRWTDVATAIGEVRRTLSALEPSAARELALEEAARLVEAYMLVGDDGTGERLLPRTNPGNKVGLAYAAAIRGLSSQDHASEYDRGVRDGIDQALEIATGQAGLMADLALEGLPENARGREAMEAALTRFADTLRVTLSDLSSMPSQDHADAGKVDRNGLRDDVAKVYVWLREPDWNEEWDLCGWLNRRPSPNSFALIHEQWERSTLPPAPTSEGAAQVADAIVMAVDALLAARKRFAVVDPNWDQWHLFPKAIEALNAAPAAIRALSSQYHANAGKVEGDGWLPIESAPKDGTVIDLWSAEFGRQPDCYWGKRSHCCGEDGQHCDSDWHSEPETWIDSAQNTETFDDIKYWRPLPPAPASEGGE